MNDPSAILISLTFGRLQGHLMWPVVELFANLDLAQLSAIVPDPMLETYEARPWNNSADSPGELAAGGYMLLRRVNILSPDTFVPDLYRAVATFISKALQQQLEDEGLQRTGYQFNDPSYRQFSDLVKSLSPQVFFFSYSRINTQSSAEVVVHEDCLVQVETSDDGESENDLISRLTSSLSRYHDTGSEHDVIIEPSEVIAFHLRNTRSATCSANASALLSQKPFKYPKTLYLDRFLSDNFQLADAKRKQQMDIADQIQKLTAQRNSITHCNVSLVRPLSRHRGSADARDVRAMTR